MRENRLFALFTPGPVHCLYTVLLKVVIYILGPCVCVTLSLYNTLSLLLVALRHIHAVTSAGIGPYLNV